MSSLELGIEGAAEAEAAFDAIGARAVDLSPVWPELYEVFLEGERDRFASSGPGWAPLQPATVERKGFATIMVESGDLRASLTEAGAPGAVFRSSPDGAQFGTDYKSPRQTKGWAQVALAYFHQEGLPPNPRRPLIDPDDAYVDDFAPLITDWLMGVETASEVTT